MADVTSRFKQLRDRYEWLDHLVRAGTRYSERHGNDYGAAVTYFSVLSLVPMMMIVFAAAGFALALIIHGGCGLGSGSGFGDLRLRF